MPSFTRNKKRENLVFVAVNEYLYSGFKSKDLASFSGISNDDVLALGHLPESGVSVGKLKILGANTPKPPRVSKKLSTANTAQQKSISTYCAYDALGDLYSKGWQLVDARKPVSLSRGSVARGYLTAIAILSNSIRYCYPMNKADFDEFGAILGLKSAADPMNEIDIQKLITGASKPKPGRASTTLDNGSKITSFYSDAKLSDLLDAGWNILSEEIILESGTPFLL